MAPRHEFTPVQNAAQGVGGAQNNGILITRHKFSGKLYIEKRIPLALIAQGDSRREVGAMQQCSTHPHPNIVRLVSYELQPPPHIPYGSLWLQHCELGSLDRLMLQYMRLGQHLADEGFVWKVFFDLALAIAYLHTGCSERETRERAQVGKDAKMVAGWNPIIHRDLKPSNIFLSWKHADGMGGYPTVLVGDFGCAVSAHDIARGSRVHLRTDILFEPPEAATWNFSEKADVWGVGLVIHCLVVMSQEPMGTRTERQIAPFGACRTTKWLRDVAKVCLQKDMGSRPGPAELPRLVIAAYKLWKREGGRGSVLPGWAFGRGAM